VLLNSYSCCFPSKSALKVWDLLPFVCAIPPGLQLSDNKSDGGEGGIRTPGTVSRTVVFKTTRFNHSRTSPFPV
jgi:hypothetical protein